MKTTNRVQSVMNPTNGAEDAIALSEPYAVSLTLEGVCPIIFHAWNCDAVAEKAGAKKGSKQKKEDNVESYVVRNKEGELCIPGTYLAASIWNAARFFQDPRSPRKSARDLYRAAVFVTTELASLGVKEWDYLDRRRMTVQQASLTRLRPALLAGWKASFEVRVSLPEYIAPHDLRATMKRAGELVGLADSRPTYGRFDIVGWEVLG